MFQISSIFWNYYYNCNIIVGVVGLYRQQENGSGYQNTWCYTNKWQLATVQKKEKKTQMAWWTCQLDERTQTYLKTMSNYSNQQSTWWWTWDLWCYMNSSSWIMSNNICCFNPLILSVKCTGTLTMTRILIISSYTTWRQQRVCCVRTFSCMPGD